MTIKIPEVITDITSEEYETATQEVRDRHRNILSNPRSRQDHAQVTQDIDERQTRKAVKLGELRKLAGLTQANLAEVLGMAQGDVSRVEHRQQPQLATVARYVNATGGSLRLTAVYDDAEYTIDLGEIPAETIEAE